MTICRIRVQFSLKGSNEPPSRPPADLPLAYFPTPARIFKKTRSRQSRILPHTSAYLNLQEMLILGSAYLLRTERNIIIIGRILTGSGALPKTLRFPRQIGGSGAPGAPIRARAGPRPGGGR